jgi:hypothetical protein
MAAENIQAKRTVFRKRVACQMRFRQQVQTCDTAGTGKLMPYRLAYGMEINCFDKLVEQSLQRIQTRQRGRIAAMSFYNPFDAAHYV